MEIQKSVIIGKTPESVFKAISEGLLFKVTGIVEETFIFNFEDKGNYSFEWPEVGKCRGTFSKIAFNEKLSFSWIKSEAVYSKEPMKTQVEITLQCVPEGTRLNLEHTGFNIPKAYHSHNEGWDDVLEEFSKQII